MNVDASLIKEFVDVTNDQTEIKQETTVYGTIVELNDKKYVRIDGSDLLTPIGTTVSVADGDRVSVMIKNHTATVTGNVTSPAAKDEDVKEIGNKISEFEIVIADKVSTKEFDAEKGRIDDLVSDNVTIKEKLTANEGYISDLQADNVTINEKLTAADASIKKMEVEKLDATAADIKYATVENLNVTNETVHNIEGDYASFKQTTTDKLTANEASIRELETKKLDAEEAEIKYANIDFANIGDAAIENFYAKSGVIQDVVISDGQVTGTLVGVTIKGDLIEGGTVVADKLVIQGEDGLYYKLNTNGETVTSEQTEYNSLSGTIITAKSVTAEKIAVDDLVAFNATIGGFNITDSAIYSGVKGTVDNTTRGIYLDKSGQIAFGDSSNYLKFYKNSEGKWKLLISADEMIMSSSGKSVETEIGEAKANSIVKSEEEFYKSTSPVSLVGGSWEKVQPEWEEGTYIWRRTAVTYGDGSSEYTPSQNGVCITGNTGAQGEQGEPGKDGATGIGYTILLTNENHTFAGSTTAAIESSASTNVVAYKNTAQVSATISKIGSTSVIDNASGVATGITGLTATITSNGSTSCAIQFNATTSLTTKSGSVQIEVTVDGKTFTKNFSFSLALAGNDGSSGTNAKSVDIIASAQIFKSTDGGLTFSPDTIKLTPAFQGGVKYSKWSYSTDGGSTWNDVTSGSNGLTISTSVLTISKGSDLYTDLVTAISFKCVSDDSTYYDIVTIVKLYDITDIDIGGRNYILNSKNLGDFINENSSCITTELTADSITITRTAGTSSYYGIYYDVEVTADTEYTFSFNVVSITGTCHYSIGRIDSDGNTSWMNIVGRTAFDNSGRQSVTFTTSSDAVQARLYISIATVDVSVTVNNAKLELGNKATDWTPAPEDSDNNLNEAVNNVNNSIEETNERVTEAESLIAKLNDVIAMLVTESVVYYQVDYNAETGEYTESETVLDAVYGTELEGAFTTTGKQVYCYTVEETTEEGTSPEPTIIYYIVTGGTSLMTQTSDGWTFSMGTIQSTVNNTSNGLNDLTNKVGEVEGTVDTLQQAVDDLGETAKYVKIVVYEDEPCIELGESDSDFKLLITNTRIMFKQGSNTPTYINTDGLVTQNIEVKDEIRQGEFVWRIHGNGNLGLIWKGGDS